MRLRTGWDPDHLPSLGSALPRVSDRKSGRRSPTRDWPPMEPHAAYLVDRDSERKTGGKVFNPAGDLSAIAIAPQTPTR